MRQPISKSLVILLSLLAGLSATLCRAESGRRPNMIVVLVDDLRWDEIGCAGHPFVRTPNIDRSSH